jgi:hypothetical protein
MQERRKISSSVLETVIQDTLAAVVEIDCWYDLELKELDFYPKAIRSEVAAEIRRLHRLNHQPYVLHLSRRHQMIVFRSDIQRSCCATAPSAYWLFPIPNSVAL